MHGFEDRKYTLNDAALAKIEVKAEGGLMIRLFCPTTSMMLVGLHAF